jgi:hypothetical protein
MWLRKFTGILLISLGAALVYLQFPNRLEGERLQEVVDLEVSTAPFTEAQVGERFGDGVLELDYDGMKSTPEIRDVVLSLMDESGSYCVDEVEWRIFTEERSITETAGLVYSFRDGLHEITSVELLDDATYGEIACLEIVLLGAYDNPDWGSMTWIEKEQLDDYPTLAAELERLAAGSIPAQGGRGVPVREWRQFDRRELDTLDYRPQFIVFGHLFAGSVDHAEMPWTLATPWLEIAAMAAGIAALLAGLVLFVASYRATAGRPGVQIAPVWLAVFCDVISLIGGLIFVTLAIDTFWVGPLGQSSLLGLEPEWPSEQAITGLHFISVPVVLLALPLLTLWFASLSAQRVAVDERGVTSHGAIGSSTITWDELRKVELREQRNPFAFTVVDFRKLQTVLDLEGDEVALTINEPPFRRRKRKLLDLLLEHAPEDRKELIRAVESRW